MIRYFKFEGGEFNEVPNSQNYYIKIVPMDNVYLVHMMDGNPNPNVDKIVEFVDVYKPNKLIIDFTAVETYVENSIIEQIESKILNVELRILSVNITNNKYTSHRFFPVHAFQLVDRFEDLINPIFEIQNVVLATKKRLKKYLFLNHHLRTERFKIFESLHNNDNLNDGLVSFNWTLDTHKFVPQEYSVSNTDIEYIRNSNAYNLLPIELDGNNNTPPIIQNDIVGIQNPVYFSPPNTNITHYFNVYFEIITEGFSSNTPFHPYVDRTNLLHYSEKIYKPILFGVPFCFWGPENTLEEFKEKFGFRFDCPLYYCNVGYDLKQFCDKINELANLPYEELHNIYYQYIADIKHNQNTLLNYLKNLHI